MGSAVFMCPMRTRGITVWNKQPKLSFFVLRNMSTQVHSILKLQFIIPVEVNDDLGSQFVIYSLKRVMPTV